MMKNKTVSIELGLREAMDFLRYTLGGTYGYVLGTDPKEEDAFILNKLDEKLGGDKDKDFSFVLARYEMCDETFNKLRKYGIDVYDEINDHELGIISKARAIVSHTIGS